VGGTGQTQITVASKLLPPYSIVSVLRGKLDPNVTYSALTDEKHTDLALNHFKGPQRSQRHANPSQCQTEVVDVHHILLCTRCRQRQTGFWVPGDIATKHPRSDSQVGNSCVVSEQYFWSRVSAILYIKRPLVQTRGA